MNQSSLNIRAVDLKFGRQTNKVSFLLKCYFFTTLTKNIIFCYVLLHVLFVLHTFLFSFVFFVLHTLPPASCIIIVKQPIKGALYFILMWHYDSRIGKQGCSICLLSSLGSLVFCLLVCLFGFSFCWGYIVVG